MRLQEVRPTTGQVWQPGFHGPSVTVDHDGHTYALPVGNSDRLYFYRDRDDREALYVVGVHAGLDYVSLTYLHPGEANTVIATRTGPSRITSVRVLVPVDGAQVYRDGASEDRGPWGTARPLADLTPAGVLHRLLGHLHVYRPAHV